MAELLAVPDADSDKPSTEDNADDGWDNLHDLHQLFLASSWQRQPHSRSAHRGCDTDSGPVIRARSNGAHFRQTTRAPRAAAMLFGSNRVGFRSVLVTSSFPSSASSVVRHLRTTAATRAGI